VFHDDRKGRESTQYKEYKDYKKGQLLEQLELELIKAKQD